MEVDPLAAESLGVRSLAVRLTVDGTEVLIDPGAALGPRREGLRPHLEEYRALKAAVERIDAAAETADVIVVTHYHFDHYVPSFENYESNWSSEARARRLFADAHVVAKHPTEAINYSQRKRAYYARKVFDDVAASVTWADGQTVEHGSVTLRVSPPVPHGPAGTKLGTVLMVAVEGPGRTVCYTSDAQGPVEAGSTDWLLDREPDLVVSDGPPRYLVPYKFSPDDLERAAGELMRLAAAADLLVDHHLLRQPDYRTFLGPVEDAADDHGHAVETFAEHRGDPERLLEARRADLHEHEPVDEAFYDRVAAGEFVDGEFP